MTHLYRLDSRTTVPGCPSVRYCTSECPVRHKRHCRLRSIGTMVDAAVTDTGGGHDEMSLDVIAKSAACLSRYTYDDQAFFIKNARWN